MSKGLENVSTVKKRELYFNKQKNKISERDICTNASNCGVQLKNETDKKRGALQTRDPYKIPTQKNTNVKERYTNECCTKILKIQLL